MEYKAGVDQATNEKFVLIKELADYIGGIILAVRISGGSYDAPSLFSIGSQQVSVGQLYVNIREIVNQYKDRMKVLLQRIGTRNLVVFT